MHWLARQLLRLVVVLFCVTLVTFVIVNILPGDIAIVILGTLATPQDIAGLRADLVRFKVLGATPVLSAVWSQGERAF